MVKYPEACKKSPAGTATFYGADIMDDPAFDGDQPLTIVEGEIDKLASWQPVCRERARRRTAAVQRSQA
jgi:hypothetical protein